MANALGTPGGVVTDEDHRIADAGLVAAQTTTLAVRTGVLVGPGLTSLVSGTAATAPMTYSIAPHHWVTQRASGDGVYLGALAAATTVSTTAAPGSNSRIDIIWSKQNDLGSTVTPDSGTTEATYGVTQGTAAASPTAPTIPVGAVEIGRATVATGATTTNSAQVTISQTARLTSARGTRVICRTTAEETALTQYAGLEIYRIDTGQIKVSNGSAFAVTYDPAFVVTSAPRGRVGSASATAVGPAGIGATETMFDPVTFTAVAGRRYKVTWDGSWVPANAMTVQFTVRTASGGTVTTAGTRQHARYLRTEASGAFEAGMLVAEITGLSAGTTTVGIGARVVIGGGTLSITGEADNQRKIIVEDIGT